MKVIETRPGLPRKDERPFARPDHGGLRITSLLALGFAVLWIFVYGGASWLTSLHPFRIPVHMDWELTLPFVPAMAIVYLSLTPMMLLSLFVFRTWREIVPLLVVLVAQTVIAGFCFLILPVERAFEQPMPAGPFAGLFRIADFINLEGNYLPSLHVSYAFTTALAIRRRRGLRLGGAFLLWASGIAISALLLHQHYCADIAAALVLTWLTMGWLYDRSGKPESLRALRAEMICLGEISRFSRRHRRYLLIAILVYGHSLFRWRELRPIRIGFCFLQHIDDVLDGDRPSPIEPTDVVDQVLEQIERRSFDDTPISCLAHCLWEEMARFQGGEDDPRGELLTLIRRMRFDRIRVKERLLLSRYELLSHHRETFYHAVNLMLMFGGAKLRARDAPDLIEAFGWCSTMRDLQEDIEKGLINIPASVIEAARSEGLDAMTYGALLRTPAVGHWMHNDYTRAAGHLDCFEKDLPRLAGANGVAILRLFHRSIRRFAEKAARTHGWNRHARIEAGVEDGLPSKESSRFIS